MSTKCRRIVGVKIVMAREGMNNLYFFINHKLLEPSSFP
jgi:hypothetical protein